MKRAVTIAEDAADRPHRAEIRRGSGCDGGGIIGAATFVRRCAGLDP